MAAEVVNNSKIRAGWFPPQHSGINTGIFMDKTIVDVDEVLAVVCTSDGNARMAKNRMFGSGKLEQTLKDNQAPPTAYRKIVWMNAHPGKKRSVTTVELMCVLLEKMKSEISKKLARTLKLHFAIQESPSNGSTTDSATPEEPIPLKDRLQVTVPKSGQAPDVQIVCQPTDYGVAQEYASDIREYQADCQMQLAEYAFNYHKRALALAEAKLTAQQEEVENTRESKKRRLTIEDENHKLLHNDRFEKKKQRQEVVSTYKTELQQRQVEMSAKSHQWQLDTSAKMKALKDKILMLRDVGDEEGAQKVLQELRDF